MAIAHASACTLDTHWGLAVAYSSCISVRSKFDTRYHHLVTARDFENEPNESWASASSLSVTVSTDEPRAQAQPANLADELS